MKKTIAIVLAIIMLVAVLATVLVACNNNDDPNTIRLYLYDPNDNEVKTAYDQMLAKFKEQTGITVIPIYNPKDEYNTVLQTSMMTKRQPDVFILDQPMLGTFVDYCLNLDEGFYAKEGEEGLHLSDFYDVALDTIKYKGSYYAVPFSLTTSILLYNTELVKSVPKSWEEWRNLEVPSGKALFGGIGSGGYAGWYFQAFLKSAGGDLIKDNQVVFNSAEGVRAGEMIKSLYSKSPKNIRTSSNAFTNGNVMFTLVHQSEIYNYFSSNPTFSNSKIGATTFISEYEGGPRCSNIGGENFAINKNSQNVEACKKLIKFLLEEENVNVAIENNFSAIKAYAKVRETNPVTGATYSKKLQSIMQVVLDQLETASARPVIAGWMTVNDKYLADAIAQIVDNGKDVKTELDKAQQTAMANLEF